MDTPKNDSPYEYSTEEIRQLTERLRTKERAKARKKLAEKEIQRLVESMGLNSRIESKAINLYPRLIETDLINNYSAASLVSAIVYLTCKEEKVPRTSEDVANASFVTVENSTHRHWLAYSRQIQRLYNHICKRLGRSYLPIEPQKFGCRYCKEMELDEQTKEFVQIVLETVEDEVPGRSPAAVAAGAISYAVDQLGLDVSNWDICRTTDLSSTTVRERRRDIEMIVGKL